MPHYLRQQSQLPVLSFDTPYLDYGLYLLSIILADHGKTLNDYALPLYRYNWNYIHDNALIAEELGYNSVHQHQLHINIYQQLNGDQLCAYNTIIGAIDTSQSSLFFIQGPGGTGKTFLYKCICSYYRSKNEVVLCVASSGIAALLLPGGRTSHSRFKIPLQSTSTSICNISRNTPLAALLKRTKLIIWDEVCCYFIYNFYFIKLILYNQVPMQHKYDFQAVSRTLNDICDVADECLFGNIPILLGGDFAQTLPVVRRGNRAQIVGESIQNSSLWGHFQILRLTKNMRVREGEENQRFAEWLSRMSYQQDLRGQIRLPNCITQVEDFDQFCHNIFPLELLSSATTDFSVFRSRAILTMRNSSVNEFNMVLLRQMPGEEYIFHVVNSTNTDDIEQG